MGGPALVRTIMIMTAPLLVVFDTPNLIHRSHHALAGTGMMRRDGDVLVPVWALHGTLTTIAKIITEHRPARILCGFDSQRSVSVRHQWDPDYKANRGDRSAEMSVTVAETLVALHEMGAGAVAFDGWEADDVLASAAAWARQEQWDCLVVTSDRDAYQLITVDGQVRMLRPDGVLVDDVAVRASAGVPAARYGELAALRGEPGDNLPGVPGVGVKTAAKLLTTCDDLDDVLDDEDALVTALGGRLGTAVFQHRDRVRLNRRLGALRTDLEVMGGTGGQLPFDRQQVIRVGKQFGVPNAARALAAAADLTAV